MLNNSIYVDESIWIKYSTWIAQTVYCIIILCTVFYFLIFMQPWVGNILIFHQFPKQYGPLAEAL